MPEQSNLSQKDKMQAVNDILRAEVLVKRIFEENRMVTDEKDPIFAFASICRAFGQFQDQLLQTHNQAIDTAMTQRVEMVTQEMIKSLDRLKDETLNSEFKIILAQILDASNQSHIALSKMNSLLSDYQQISEQNLKAARRQRIFHMIATFFTSAAFLGTLALFFIILK